MGRRSSLVGEIVRMVELGLDAKQAALPEEAACSIKVVAGACNHRQFEISTLVCIDGSLTTFAASAPERKLPRVAISPPASGP